MTSAIRYANYIYSRRGSYGSYSYTCSGSENQLLSCFTTTRSCYWWRSGVVGVRCYGEQIQYSCYNDHRYQDYILSLSITSGCTVGDVRLAGGETVMEGRVEVCHNQTWWAVRGSSYWDFRDATVVCRHLHYPANCELCNKNR